MTDPTPEIRARCEAATKGPWFKAKMGVGTPQWGVSGPLLDRGGQYRRIAICGSPRVYRGPLDDEDASNAAFIAHARTDVPWLLAALAARDAEIARLKAALEPFAKLAEILDEAWHDDDELLLECPDNFLLHKFKVRDFRRAASTEQSEVTK
jgi:hypothetical protein